MYSKEEHMYSKIELSQMELDLMEANFKSACREFKGTNFFELPGYNELMAKEELNKNEKS